MLACDRSGLAWCSPLATCDGNIAAPVMSTEQIIPKLEHVTIQSLVIFDDPQYSSQIDRQRGAPLSPPTLLVSFSSAWFLWTWETIWVLSNCRVPTMTSNELEVPISNIVKLMNCLPGNVNVGALTFLLANANYSYAKDAVLVLPHSGLSKYDKTQCEVKSVSRLCLSVWVTGECTDCCRTTVFPTSHVSESNVLTITISPHIRLPSPNHSISPDSNPILSDVWMDEITAMLLHRLQHLPIRVISAHPYLYLESNQLSFCSYAQQYKWGWKL